MSNALDSLNLNLLNVGFSEQNASWNWQRVCSPFARIYYVKEGRAKTYVGGKAHILEPDYLYLTPPFTLHDDECDSYFSLYYIHFYEKALNKESVFDRYDFPVAVKATQIDLLLAERLTQINPDSYLTHFDPAQYDNIPTFSQYIAENSRMPLHVIIETQGILLQLISKFIKSAQAKSEHKDARINRALQYIHEHICQPISVSRLADISCISEDHFIRTFKKELRLTPLQYINIKKIEKAQLLLLTTDMQVSDVSFELSIENVSYFNRIFKQHTGTTPRCYRKEYIAES
ncbi:MAG: AraC family transcriptional regulator [Prevotellaceae bacterium]|jgi:AraC-like DNA-binding protein|nr:AraC family transcriptional regulator [Prevotellaceae bacterium]